MGKVYGCASKGKPVPTVRANSHRPVMTVSESERLALGLRFLSSASKVLASSFDYARTLKRVAEMTVPAFAAGFAVELDEFGTHSVVFTTGPLDPDDGMFTFPLLARERTLGALCIASHRSTDQLDD